MAAGFHVEVGWLVASQRKPSSSLGANVQRSRLPASRGYLREVRLMAGLGGGSKQAVTEHGLSAKFSPMNAHVDHILDEALGLPPDERSALTVALLDSLEGSDDSSITEAWRQEIRARQAALRAGTVAAASWAEARARLSAR
ncbi:addiction module protein [Accumulibacter sp.]|uniref:addiction module protein n=1 Tax=Accumulibacter sp. TaxID=2053492 RepID=UPI00341DE3EC